MPCGPDQFVGVAEALRDLKVPQGEGRYRTITGRAYYGAFWATCHAICQNQQINPPVSFTHETLCHTLAKFQGDRDVRAFGTILDGLRQRRVHADYTLPTFHEEEWSDDAVEDARRAMAMLPLVAPRFPKFDPPSR